MHKMARVSHFLFSVFISILKLFGVLDTLSEEVSTMMKSSGLQLWAAVLLLVGGLVHLIPPLYTGLSNLTGGNPWIQILVGVLSVIVALVMFAGDKSAAPAAGSSSSMPKQGGGM